MLILLISMWSSTNYGIMVINKIQNGSQKTTNSVGHVTKTVYQREVAGKGIRMFYIYNYLGCTYKTTLEKECEKTIYSALWEVILVNFWEHVQKHDDLSI